VSGELEYGTGCAGVTPDELEIGTVRDKGRDTVRTKQRLLDAAVSEYSEHGPLGAGVDRVAADAGVTKERIYQYFGNK
jgi:AcrR family transcriptional regulator